MKPSDGLVVVTGASGFLGGALSKVLIERGFRVRAVQRRDVPKLRALGAEIVQADLANAEAAREALRGASAVFHVAARAIMWGPYEAFHEANVTATENVIAACRELGITRLVYTSTPSVVHAGGDVEGADESLPLATQFHSPYPETKAIAERKVLEANGPELATVALRPHLIWGPDDPQLTARVLDRARKGRLRLVDGGEKRIDGVYVDNAVEAHLKALERLSPGAPCAGRAYFIAQGEPVPQRELINGIVTAAGLPACTRSVPGWLAYALGAIAELVWTLTRRTDEPPMTRFIARQLATAHWYDISAARRDLGYTPEELPTSEGLRRLADWCRQGPKSAGSDF